MKQMPEKSIYSVQVLDRALDILELLALGQLSLSNIVRETGLARSTAFRLLAHLEARNYVVKNSDGLYQLSTKIFQLAAQTHEVIGLVSTVHPFLEELAHATQETVHVCIRDGTAAVCIDRVNSPMNVRLSVQMGAPAPLYAGAISKLLLAYAPHEIYETVVQAGLRPFTDKTITNSDELLAELTRIRFQGWAYSEGELDEGATTFAAPIRDFSGSVVAALALSAPTQRLSDVTMAQLWDHLVAGTARISEALGHAVVAPGPTGPMAVPEILLTGKTRTVQHGEITANLADPRTTGQLGNSGEA